MRAYIVSEPGKGVDAWKSVELPDPEPKRGQVLIGVRATSVNYRDLMIAKGNFHANAKKDLIPLSDGAGEILAVGEDVLDLKVGDRVAAAFNQTWLAGPVDPTLRRADLGGVVDGMAAEKVVLEATGLVKIPDYLSFEEAATLPCAAVTAWDALMEQPAPWRPGSTIVTLGSGGVSVFALQIAKLAGLRVIGTSSSDAKLERLRALGMDHGINYVTNPEWQTEVKRLTGGLGAEQVVEVGGITFGRSLQAVRPGGMISIIGSVGGASEPLTTSAIQRSGARIQPIGVGSVAMFKALNRALELHKLKPVIDTVFPFSQAREALVKIQSGTHFGKLVIRMAD